MLTNELSSSFVHRLIMSNSSDVIYGNFLNSLINRYPKRMVSIFQNILSNNCYNSLEARLDLSQIKRAKMQNDSRIILFNSEGSKIANINLNPWGSFVIGNRCMIYEKPYFRFELPRLTPNFFDFT